MRVASAFVIGALALSLIGCRSNVVGPEPPAARTAPAFAVVPTGPSNVCMGQIVAGIAATWPWAHDENVAFAPPPGSIALWIQIFGPDLGISSVRDLQLLFCTADAG